MQVKKGVKGFINPEFLRRCNKLGIWDSFTWMQRLQYVHDNKIVIEIIEIIKYNNSSNFISIIFGEPVNWAFSVDERTGTFFQFVPENLPMLLDKNIEIGIAPQNNDGRKECFWCGGKTKQYIGFNNIGNVCSDCGK